jgi:hypothetical protein
MPSRKSTVTFETVRDIALTLPGVVESTAYGVPALKIRGKLLACVPSNRSAEPGSLVVRVRFDDGTALLEADPTVYYITELYQHYKRLGQTGYFLCSFPRLGVG